MFAIRMGFCTLLSLAVLLFLGTLVSGQPTPPDLEKFWLDLADRDETRATRAALALAASPREALDLLAKKLRPVKLSEEQFQALLKKLDSDEFDTREIAYRDLEYHGKMLRARFAKVLEGKPSPEVRNQVNRLIEATYNDELPPPPQAQPANAMGGIVITTIAGRRVIKIDGREIDLNPMPKLIEKRGPQPAWLQAARAVAVLEHINTPEAKVLLKTLADGEAEALPTKSAAAALSRMMK